MAIDKSKIDVSAIFLGYMALVGDTDKTALAFDMAPADVAELAESEGWADKIRRVSVMSKSDKPGDWERAQNRALCFVQAFQIRQLINRWVKHLTGLGDADLLSKTSTVDRSGVQHYSARVLNDLVTASEACHRMSYAALGDTITERLERKGATGENPSAGDMHSAVISALNSHLNLPVDKALLLAERSEVVLASASEAKEGLADDASSVGKTRHPNV